MAMDIVIGNLRKLGLTEYESRVYLTLLKENFSSASLVARKSGVPRTKIYGVLESLRDKGWIKVLFRVSIAFQSHKS